MELPSLSELRKNLKKDASALPPLRLALLGDTPTQLLGQAIRGYGFKGGLNIDLFEADYDQIERQILDPGSELYESRPEWIVGFQTPEKLLARFVKTPVGNRTGFAETVLEEIGHFIESLKQGTEAKIIWANFPELDDAVFGNFANKTALSFLYQLRKINLGLMDLAQRQGTLYILDVSSLQNQVGRTAVVHPTMYINTGLVHTPEFLVMLAKNLFDIIGTARGQFKKCLILDLDNTVWGGIVGDDGAENLHLGELGIGRAFTELQRWAKQLQQRGIILAVCSKNNEEIARNAFSTHPDMVLKLEDIAVFIANWDNKADNIRTIQSVLNIGFDSMVFLDDSAFERNLVRAELPAVTVPELPVDPAEYLPYLRTLNLFETASFSTEDATRTSQYQREAERELVKTRFTNETEYLTSLHMVGKVEPFTDFNTPRVAQLTQRSNQFNLRTIRLTESDVQRVRSDANFYPLSFSISDRYGDYGLIAIVWMRKLNDNQLFIENWLMSCRVLKRGVEQFTLNALVALARREGFTELVGEYVPTAKNGLVIELLPSLGFNADGNQWHLSVADFSEFPVQIALHQPEYSQPISQ